MRIYCSEDTLHTVLGTIIAPGTPVINALLDKAVYMTLSIVGLQALTIREQPELEVTEERSTTLEARQVRLTHEHHLNEDDYFLCVGLEGHETACHAIPEFAESLRIFATHHIEHLLC